MRGRFNWIVWNRLLRTPAYLEPIRSARKLVLWPLVVFGLWSRFVLKNLMSLTEFWWWTLSTLTSGHMMNRLTCKKLMSKLFFKAFWPCSSSIKTWNAYRISERHCAVYLKRHHYDEAIDLCKSMKTMKMDYEHGAWRWLVHHMVGFSNPLWSTNLVSTIQLTSRPFSHEASSYNPDLCVRLCSQR